MLEEWLHNVKMKIVEKLERGRLRLCMKKNNYKLTRIISIDLYEKVKTMIETGLLLKKIARIVGVSKPCPYS